MAQPPRQTDLLAECNHERLPVQEFRSIFCQRCRNGSCFNSGWSGSQWADRMSTQVDRLLTNPNIASDRDDRFAAVRALRFLDVIQPLEVNSRDPWAGPGTASNIHLAEPDQKVIVSTLVDDAVKSLTGKDPVTVPETSPVVAAPVQRLPQPVYPPPPPQVGPTMNTDFPDDGIMLDGSTVGSPEQRAVPVKVERDPWAPVAPGERVVEAGARIKMG